MGAEGPGPARWLARGEQEIPRDDRWLTPAELERVGGMRFTKRRTEYLLRRWVAKQAVAVVAGLPDEPDGLTRIEVGNRPTGAPIALVDGVPIDREISISDRAGWAVCLVAPTGLRVGCDLEIVEPRSPGFVTDVLTVGEQGHVTALPAEDQDAAANLLWSAKESALKVLQTGLRRDTRSVEVTVAEPADDEAWGRLDIGTAEGTRLPGWWRRDGLFLLTVAADTPLPPPRVLPGSADLRAAKPVHSWLAQPLRP